MKLLEDRIRKDGTVIGTGIVKVDSFLNHQMDPVLLDQLAAEFAKRFQDAGATKVLTIEASGIAVAVLTALRMNVPAVYAKKSVSATIGKEYYTARVHSFTHDTDCDIALSKAYLNAEDRVLLIDDFLAEGEAMRGLTALCEQAGAEVAGIGVCVEKAFQPGGKWLREKGCHVESLAAIASIDHGVITFCSDPE